MTEVTALTLAEIRTFYIKGVGYSEEQIAKVPYKTLMLGMDAKERASAQFTPAQMEQFQAGGTEAVTDYPNTSDVGDLTHQLRPRHIKNSDRINDLCNQIMRHGAQLNANGGLDWGNIGDQNRIITSLEALTEGLR